MTTAPATSTAAPRYTLVRPAAVPEVTPTPDAQQRRVIEHTAGPLLVLAGPGTGKTSTLRAAVVEKINGGTDPATILLFTFGTTAARQLRGQIVRALPTVVTPPVARTFHSYAFGLLRTQAAARGHPTPRLLEGPEQDLLIRQLLAGDVAGSGVVWPQQLHAALRTRGFADQLRDLISRAYERGIDPVTLHTWGTRHGRPEWRAAAAFMQQYADVTELRGAGFAVGTAYDPAELIRAAITVLRRDRELLRAQRRAFSHIYVDEYQDSDPAHEELLRLLAGGGRFLVAFADPDQSIYGFRGADPDVVRRFGGQFTTTDGGPAPTQLLRTCHRSEPELLEVFARVAARLRGPTAQRGLHPSPARDGTAAVSNPTVSGVPASGVAVHVLASAGAQAAVITAELRHAHLLHEMPWEDMAVVVRSASGSMSMLRRAMLAAGIPVAGTRSSGSLAEEPAVAPLLWLLEGAVTPSTMDDTITEALLLSELGGGDPVRLHRLRQLLRARSDAANRGTATDVDGAAGPKAPPRSLLATALQDTSLLAGLDTRLTAPLRRVAHLIEVTRQAATVSGANAETVLWAAWEATGLGPRWRARSTEPGAVGAAAHRDLDAVMELFDAAAGFTDRMPGATLELFAQHLRGQQLPAGAHPNGRPQAPGVRLLTTHATKGQQWGLVIVAGVQEELWPDLRLRGSVLGAGDLVELAAGRALDGAAARTAAYQQLLDEERRLFYVALTRARRRLVITAVDDEDNQPSRFLDDLPRGDDAATERDAATARDSDSTVPVMLSLPSLVAQLRRVVCEPDRSAPLPRRNTAAAVLAQLAAAGVPGAAPQEWWGLAPQSDDRPLVAAADPVPVSPSAVETFTDCGLRWLLERRAGGGTPSGVRQQIGSVVHEIAAESGPGAPEAQLRAALDDKLASVDLGDGWGARRERQRAEKMIAKLAVWFAENPRRFLAAEQPFEARVGRALLRGRVDRLDVDERGRLYVVDFKTGATSIAVDKLREHPQLGVYQLAVEHGALGLQGQNGSEGQRAADGQPGGGALVQLGTTSKNVSQRTQLPLAESENPAWAAELVSAAADGMAAAEFIATKSDIMCRSCPVRPSCPAHSNQTTEPPLPSDELEAAQ